MIDSFKNFERLRYRMSTDIKNIITESNNKSNDVKAEISNTVFATIFSALVTEGAFNLEGIFYKGCGFNMLDGELQSGVTAN